MDNIHVVKEKPLAAILVELGSISLRSRPKLKKSLKNTLNCYKLQTVF